MNFLPSSACKTPAFMAAQYVHGAIETGWQDEE
jgi:hypothetical protein